MIMAKEYKLSYTASEINRKLGAVDTLSDDIDNLDNGLLQTNERVDNLEVSVGEMDIRLTEVENLEDMAGGVVVTDDGSGNVVVENGVAVPIDDELSDTSENPVQNKVITSRINNIDGRIDALELSGGNIIVDDALSDKSENPVQNKVVTEKIQSLEEELGVAIDNANSALGTATAAGNTANSAQNAANSAFDVASEAKGLANNLESGLTETNNRVATLENTGMVLYAEQSLTDEQKTQARVNIGAGQPIIDVFNELPTENIDNTAFYRLLIANCVENNEIDGSKSCYCTDNLPTFGIPAMDLASGAWTVYYNMSDGIVYAYIDDMLSGFIASQFPTVGTMDSGWYPFESFTGLLGINYGGVVTSMDEAWNGNTFYIVVSSSLYSYNNQWKPLLVQPDWNQEDNTQPDYIWNKPNMAQVAQSDWNVADESDPAAIKNRPFGDIPSGIVIYDGWVNCTSLFQGMYFTNGTYLFSPPKFLNGVVYKVTLNDVEWGEIVAENNSLQYSEYTYFTQTGFQLFDTQLDGEYRLNIIVAQDSSYQIDPKYLPSTLGIGKKGSGTGAEIFNDYYNNVASGDNSHAEGRNTTASGNCSHAEGINTTASGIYSHAEGHNTTASGIYSHAEGSDTTAASDSQHVQGRYNKEDSTGTYAHIVGNGSFNVRSNAHTLDWDGNAWFQGNVYVGGTGQDDLAAKRLLTEDDISDIALPSATTADNGKLLQVVDGKPAWVAITNGNEVAY